MKKLIKPMFAIFLAITLSIFTMVASFAGSDDDPGGKCYIAIPYNTIYDNK